MQRGAGLVATLLLLCLLPVVPVVGQASSSIILSEFYVSTNSLYSNNTCTNCHGALDLNGDGEYGKYSDQFIELHNPTGVDLDLAGFTLEYLEGGASSGMSCTLAGSGSLMPAGSYRAVFSASSNIHLNWYEGGDIVLLDASGALVDTASFTDRNSQSFYGSSYALDGSQWVQSDPTPGLVNSETWSVVDSSVHSECTPIDSTQYSDAYILSGRVVPMTGENAVKEDASILIQDGKIEAIWESEPPVDITGITVIETGGTIYPGLIDGHNHMHYNHVPLWDFDVHVSSTSQSSEGGYANRNQWKNHPDYGRSITWHKNLNQYASFWGFGDEQMKYSEVKALAGGVTAVQGSPTSYTSGWDDILVRNIELDTFGHGDEIHTKVTTLEDDYVGAHITRGNESHTLDGWYLHLAEGVDESSRAEFDILVQNGLLVDELILVHGTALTPAEFQQMGAVGADLAWSPLSNLLLYGNTTDVRAADRYGVRISLAPDWSPSGAKSSLHELKVADQWNQQVMGGHFSDYDLVSMVTRNPSFANNWDEYVGRLLPNMVADIVVLDTFHEDPYRNMIEAIDADVRLTMVGGMPLFGDEFIMKALKGDDWESIEGSGFSKAVDVTFPSAFNGHQRWSEISSNMAISMSGDTTAMKEHWTDGQSRSLSEFEDWLDDEWPGYGDVPLDPIFTTGDARYFDVINRSKHGNTHIDLSVLWSRYYDIEMVDGDRTGGTLAVVSTGQGGPTPDDPSTVENTTTSDPQSGDSQLNGDLNSSENASLVTTPPIATKGAGIDGSVIFLGVGAVTMVLFAIGAVLFAVGTISRSQRPDLSDEDGFLWDPGQREKR